MKPAATDAPADTAKARWERDVLEPTLRKSPERPGPFTTISGRPIDRLYTAEDVPDFEVTRDAPAPGEFPYTRGIHPTGYRGKVWTMRQFAGFGTPEETNERYKQLLSAGGTGLSVAFDLPTLMGRDPDDVWSLGCRSARWASAACPSCRWPIWSVCLRELRWLTSRRR